MYNKALIFKILNIKSVKSYSDFLLILSTNKKLNKLMQDASLREQFGWAAKEKMKTFEGKAIAKKFYRFITQHSASN